MITIKQTLRTSSAIAILLIVSAKLSFAADCTESEAYDKMMALGRAQSRIMSSGGQAGMSVGSKLATDTAMVGQMLADKKFGEACRKYDEIAAKYKIDLTKEQDGMVTYNELAKDGGKRGGECGLAEAQKKMMGMHQQLQDQVALGDVDSNVFRQFGEDTAKLNELMFTDPSEVCRRLDGLKEKYKVK